jgi:predicted  nucleic acid-binding Zn-ribbon protein
VRVIAGRLGGALAESGEARERAAAAAARRIDGVRGSIAEVRGSLPARAAALEKARHSAGLRPLHRAAVAAEDAPALARGIEKARASIAKEVGERNLVDAELAHVRQEIERARAMISRFQASLTPAQQRAADATNAKLRVFIEAQRDEYKHAIAVQKKKNQELERQKRELADEEVLLASVMRGLEKKAQAQMHRLPSLAEMHRQGAAPAPRRPMTAARTADDAEIRTVKKTMAQMRSQRAASKSALVGSPYHRV